MSASPATVVPFPAKPDSRWDYRFGAANRRYGLRGGDPGIARTVHWMSGLARGNEGANHPHVRQQAIDICRGLEPRDKQALYSAVFEWVKQHIDFRGEYQELLQTPVVTLQLRAGDCDDQSTLLAALLKTLGFDTRFQTVASDASDPEQFTHVFCEVMDPSSGEWTAMDTTVKESYPGWRPNAVYRQKSWPGLGDASDVFGDITNLLEPLAQGGGIAISGVNPYTTSVVPTFGGVPWYWIALGALALVWVARK